MIDTHIHLTDNKLKDNINQILENAKKNGIKLLINNTSNYKDSIFSISISNKYKQIYTTIGIHPLDIHIDNIYRVYDLEKHINNNKVVAIGEIGLDYHYSKDNIKEQKVFFIKQIELAVLYDLPVVIHARESVEDTIDIIKNYNLKGTFHCYSGSINQLKTILDLGYYIGFDGPITFKKNNEYVDLLKYTPFDRILCETDSPYLTPVPYRGKINEPMYCKYIYEKISEIKNINIDLLIPLIHKNVLNLFSKIKEENVNY